MDRDLISVVQALTLQKERKVEQYMSVEFVDKVNTISRKLLGFAKFVNNITLRLLCYKHSMEVFEKKLAEVEKNKYLLKPGELGITNLPKQSQEYKEIEALFLKSAPGINIQKVTKIHNPKIFIRYEDMKEYLIKNLPQGINEMRLFHSIGYRTAEKVGQAAIDSVYLNSEGFQSCFYPNLLVPFFEDSKDALVYRVNEGGHSVIFLANVLLGNKRNAANVLGITQDYIKSNITYDSFFDPQRKYGIFRNQQACPTHILYCS